MTKPNTVVLTSRFLYLLDRGDKLRIFNQIKSLSQHLNIHLITFIRANVDSAELEICIHTPERSFVWITHPNAKDDLQALTTMQVILRLILPVKYHELIELYHYTSLVITNWGGIQEEVIPLNIPAIIVRDKTEQLEGIEGHDYLLYNPFTDKLPAMFNALVKSPTTHMPYGNSGVSVKITKHLLNACNNL